MTPFGIDSDDKGSVDWPAYDKIRELAAELAAYKAAVQAADDLHLKVFDLQTQHTYDVFAKSCTNQKLVKAWHAYQAARAKLGEKGK